MCNLNIDKKIQKMIKNGMKLLFEHRMSKFKNNTGQLSDVKLNLIPGMGLAHHQLQFGITFLVIAMKLKFSIASQLLIRKYLPKYF